MELNGVFTLPETETEIGTDNGTEKVTIDMINLVEMGLLELAHPKKKIDSSDLVLPLADTALIFWGSWGAASSGNWKLSSTALTL